MTIKLESAYIHNNNYGCTKAYLAVRDVGEMQVVADLPPDLLAAIERHFIGIYQARMEAAKTQLSNADTLMRVPNPAGAEGPRASALARLTEGEKS